MSDGSKNLEKYEKVFIQTFSISEDDLTDTLEYNSIPEWDSLGHMSLIAQLEEVFDVNLKTDDIIDFSTFKKGKEILKKYDLNI